MVTAWEKQVEENKRLQKKDQVPVVQKDKDLFPLRWEGAALGCLQEAGEAYMIGEYVSNVGYLGYIRNLYSQDYFCVEFNSFSKFSGQFEDLNLCLQEAGEAYMIGEYVSNVGYLGYIGNFVQSRLFLCRI